MIRLQQIADETGISVGHLAYHFNNKEAITETLIANVVSGFEDLLKEYGKYSSLTDLDFSSKNITDLVPYTDFSILIFLK